MLVLRFGCCSDNETEAEGIDGIGCCKISEFGCCGDDITEAKGPAMEGCPAEEEPQEEETEEEGEFCYSHQKKQIIKCTLPGRMVWRSLVNVEILFY